MIRCLIVQISRNSRGQPVRKEHLIAGETIQIGRAAECKVLLADPRVNLHHATIRFGENRKLYIDGSDGKDLFVNDSFQRYTECAAGTQILIGSFKLVVESTDQPDCDLVLAISPIELLPAQAAENSKQYPLTLAGTGLSKRRVTFWAAGLLAILCFLLPLMQSLPTTKLDWKARVPFSFLEFWNLGQMSHGHRSLSAKCDVCHEKPFTPVADKVCEGCHVSNPHLQDKSVHASAFKNMRCVACHPDHRGETPMTRLDKQCVSCHGDIKAKSPKSKRPNVHDFSVDHPAFKLTLQMGHQENEIKRVMQQDKVKIIEKSGLKFSHQVHLDKKGISTPEGDTVMVCQDCHQADEADMRFKPISMEKSCQKSGCHALDFDPPVPDRALPHGSERKLMTTLNEYYVKSAIDEMLTGKTRRCGDEPTKGNNLLERALSCAATKVVGNTDKLFNSKEGCGECHEVTEDQADKAMPWKVKPVTITSHWLRNAAFPHGKHSTEKCTACHDKESSQKSQDIAIPDIKKCRECHVGTKVVKGKVSSSCEMCHVFHNGEIQSTRKESEVNQ
jgi:hypothetical protein